VHAIEFLDAPGKHKTGPAVVVHGKERFLKLEAIKQVSGLALGQNGDEFGLTRLGGRELDLKTVVDSLLTVSMWHPRQVVLVEDADEFVSEFRAGLEAYLERPAKKALLILDVKTWPANTRLAKKIAAVGLPIECSELKGAALINWIVKSCGSRHGKKIDREAAQLLTHLAGDELGQIDQELGKLAASIGEKPAIDAASVEKLVGGWKSETTWKMLDAVRDGHVATAVELLDKLIAAGEPAIKLLGGINYVYRPVAKAIELSRQGLSLDAALAQSGVKPFTISPLKDYLRRLTRPRAERILTYLLSADVDLKRSSGLDDRQILERLLLQLAGNI